MAQVFQLFGELLAKRIVSVSELVSTAANRMCLFGAVISLSKWSETYESYSGIMGLLGEEPRRLKAGIDDKGIVAFRNQVAAHTRSDTLGRPLSNDEIDEWIRVRGRLHAFISWIHSGEVEGDDVSVVLALERIRDAIQQTFELTQSDLFS